MASKIQSPFPPRVLAWDGAEYPQLLRESRAAAPNLYVCGQLAPLDARPVAMVGTRTPSWNGRAVARQLVEALAGHRTSIVSGLAVGIDLACHQAALELGIHTIAVLGQSLDEPIHGERARVAERILAAGGALVSAFPPGTPAFKGNFLARNAIIAGLAVATIVIESREQGGALNTAEHCLDDGRLLLAVPGDVLRDTAQGPNILVETGEALAVWTPVQFPILCGLEQSVGAEVRSTHAEVVRHKEVLANLPKASLGLARTCAGETLCLEELLERSGIELPELLQALSHLEVAGLVTKVQGRAYQFAVRGRS